MNAAAPNVRFRHIGGVTKGTIYYYFKNKHALLTRLASLMLVSQLRSDPKCRQIFSPEPHDPIGQALRRARPGRPWRRRCAARAGPRAARRWPRG